MNVAFPWHPDGRGRSATATAREHVRNLVLQVLLTAPGERVMRPDFGSGLHGMVFEPGGPEAAATTQLLVQAGLQQWLAARITVDLVEVDHREGTLAVTVHYVILRTGEAVTEVVEQAVG